MKLLRRLNLRRLDALAITLGLAAAGRWLVDHDRRLEDVEQRLDAADKAAGELVELAPLEEPQPATRVTANGARPFELVDEHAGDHPSGP